MKNEENRENLPSLSSGKTYPEYSAAEITLSDVFLQGLPVKAVNWNHQGKNGQTLVMCWDQKGLSAGECSTLNFFGVAQRRRRVFVIASARGDIDPAKILFESEGMRRDTPPRRKAGKGITANTGRRIANGSHWYGEYNPHPTLNQSHNIGGIGQSNQELFSQRGGGIVGVFRMRAFGDYVNDETASTVKARDHKDATDLTVTYSDVSRTLLAKSNDSMAEDLDTYAIHGTQDPDTNINFAHTLGRNHGQENAVAYAFKAGQGAKAGGIGWAEEQSPTLAAASSGSNLSPSVMKDMAVRRLTPVECERLQGFPDNHTLIPRDKRKQITADEYAYVRHHNPKITAEEAYRLAKDGPRYKAIGNSMAVPVMRWIGKRIKEALDA